MGITAISRDYGVEPSIVRILTTDNLTAITTNGYITSQNANINAILKGDFQWATSDYVLINYSGGEGFFSRDPVNNKFIAEVIPGGLSSTLSNGDIFVGNASNIATGVAVSGDITMSNAGVATIANSAITDVKIAAATITNDKLVDGTITGTKIANTTIAAANIVDLTITGGKIAAATITADKLVGGSITTTQLSPETVQYAKIPITSAQFLNLGAADVTLVTSPGAGTVIAVDRCFLVMNYNSIPYAAGGGVKVRYSSVVPGTGAVITDPFAPDITGSTINFYAEGIVTNFENDMADCINHDVVLGIQGPSFTTGDSDFVFHIWYSIVTVF